MNQRERFQQLLKDNEMTQIDLLRKIIIEVSPEDVDNLDKYSANFSRMISGERSLPQNYIVVIEEVLDTTINYIVTGRKNYIEAGIKQTAFTDKKSGYNRLMEYDHEHYVLTAFDEFGYTLFDYILMFKSVNGLKFMIKNNIIKTIYNGNISYSTMSPDDSKITDLAKFVYEMDDLEIYNTLYNSDYNDITFYQYRNQVLYGNEILESIIKTTKIFNSLLVTNVVDFDNINTSRIEGGYSVITYKPILKKLFEYIMLNNLFEENKFESLLNFIIQHNTKVFDKFIGKMEGLHISNDGFIFSGPNLFGMIFDFNFDNFKSVELEKKYREKIDRLEEQIRKLKNK